MKGSGEKCKIRGGKKWGRMEQYTIQWKNQNSQEDKYIIYS